MRLIDTHTHIYSEQFEEDLDEVMFRADAQGVESFILPSIDRSYFDRMERVKLNYPSVTHLMMGLHPCSVKKESYEDELAFVYEQLQTGRYVAVGEIGIDLYWDTTTLAEQQIAFDRQIAWAKEFELPINIHCREAFDEVFEVLENHQQPIAGVFHCFTGTEAQAHRAIDLGLSLGIGGVATFKNGKINQFLQNIPLEKIVLETDAPYLAPTPNRGKRNEPAFLRLVAEKLAEIYACPMEKIASITTQNAEEIFFKL